MYGTYAVHSHSVLLQYSVLGCTVVVLSMSVGVGGSGIRVRCSVFGVLSCAKLKTPKDSWSLIDFGIGRQRKFGTGVALFSLFGTAPVHLHCYIHHTRMYVCSMFIGTRYLSISIFYSGN